MFSHMEDYQIIECDSEDLIKDTFKVMKQLHLHLDDSYVDLVQEMQRDKGYKLYACLTEKNECIGVVGFVFESRLSSGRIIYLDDLVIDEASRGLGVGSKLLDLVIENANQQNCDAILLDCGNHRTESHQFYLKKGFDNTALDFKMSLT